MGDLVFDMFEDIGFKELAVEDDILGRKINITGECAKFRELTEGESLPYYLIEASNDNDKVVFTVKEVH